MPMPMALRQAIEKGECALFIGAGIGGHYKDAEGKPLPGSQGLADELVAHFGKLNIPKSDLPKVAQLVEIRASRADLDSFIKKRFDNLEPDEHLRWLTSFPWRSIYTTNYDMGIERAYRIEEHPPQNPIPISMTADMRYTDTQVDVPIFHLHGTPYEPCPSEIVITQRDYTMYQRNRKMVWDRLRIESVTSTVLYIGYSGNDPNWQLIMEEMSREFLPNKPPIAFRLDPYADEVDIEIHKEVRRIETLKMSLSEFHKLVDGEIGDYRPAADTLNKARNTVPQHLRAAFDKSASPVLRLLESWIYVNDEDLNSEPNTPEFLRGFTPNWSLIAQDRRFLRDVEAPFLDWILEFSTTDAKSAAAALTGPAGYGITTILMAIAVKIVQAKWGMVFMLREGAQMYEGDILFASNLFPDFPCYFVIDKAKDHALRIQSSLAQQRGINRNSLFILGSRRNEWLSANVKFHTKDFDVDPLSDDEINRLLDFLTAEKSLGELAELDRTYQFSIVKNKQEQQLLVAMREAMAGEGVGFDTIIESEYKGVQEGLDDSIARELYLLVCCFYQHGMLIRDHLFEGILDIPLLEIYDKVGKSLDGMVDYVETNTDRGLFAARARHRTIANIVWKKCGSRDRKEYLLQKSLENMNLIEPLDRKVFDLFISSAEIVNTFRTLEGKIRFFETAIKLDWKNVYVLQHYAMMLLDEKQFRLALQQIDEALLKSKPKMVRSLHHTRGLVLTEMAITEANLDMARKRSAQSEREFAICIADKETDSYGHSGLATLMLKWSRRPGISTAEAAESVERAEKAVMDGLKIVKEKTSLFIVAAAIEKELGNRPEWLSRLRQAVDSNSASEVGRYLLGRAYRLEKKPEKTIEVLTTIVHTDFKNVRSYLEYTRAMLDLGEPLKKCIATLSQCRVDGESDAAYVGLLGGLFFLDGRFADANKLWEDAKEHEFSYEERQKKRFSPRDPGDQSKPLRMKGVVEVVKPGYIFIQPDGGGRVLSIMTFVGGSALKVGDKLDFEITFSAKGAFAEHLKRTGEPSVTPQTPPGDQLSLSLE